MTLEQAQHELNRLERLVAHGGVGVRYKLFSRMEQLKTFIHDSKPSVSQPTPVQPHGIVNASVLRLAYQIPTVCQQQ